MFRKLLASVGIGNARIETHLHNNTTAPGGTITGEVHIMGGDVEQDIEALYLFLVTRYTREYDDSKMTHDHTIGQYPLTQRFKLQPGAQQRIPFSINLPLDTPLTMGHQPVFIRTGLSISGGVDAGDVDQLQIQPHPSQATIIQAIQQIGFQLYTVHNEYNSRWRGPYPFVQELEFKPYGHQSFHIEELEVVLDLQDYGVDVYLEIDKRLHGFAKLFADFDLNERYAKLTFTHADIQRPDLAHIISQTIQSRIRH
jgi:sporulation-control protein